MQKFETTFLQILSLAWTSKVGRLKRRRQLKAAQSSHSSLKTCLTSQNLIYIEARPTPDTISFEIKQMFVFDFFNESKTLAEEAFWSSSLRF